LRRVIIVVAVIIAVPVMMWTITIFIRSYAPTPTRPLLTRTEPLLATSFHPKSHAAQSTPAPLLTDAARTAGDGLASLPDPYSGSLRGPLALPQGDTPPPAASPTVPAETAPNAPAVVSGEAAAVTDSAQSAAASPTGPVETAPHAPAASAVTDSAQSATTAETASSEAVTPVQRDRLTATGPATGGSRGLGPSAMAGSIAPVGPVPLPRVRPVDAPVDTPPVPRSPLSDSPLLAHPAPYSGPGSDSAH
jgi:hypothetical protein